MSDMNIRVETLVKRVTEKSRPMMSKVKEWQAESQRYAQQNALGALKWVKNAAEQAEKKLHEWEAPTAAEEPKPEPMAESPTQDGGSLAS